MSPFNRWHEIRCRNLLEYGAKLERRLPAECAFEAMLRNSPARTGFGHGSLTGLCQRYHTAAPILSRYIELHETPLIERAQEVAQCRPTMTNSCANACIVLGPTWLSRDKIEYWFTPSRVGARASS